MKFDNRLILILVAAAVIYAIFLFASDYDTISETISSFNVNFLPHILFFATASWIPIFIKWHFLLKNSNIHVPVKGNIVVFLSGMGLELTPGHVGALIKSQILKTKFSISRTKTAPIVLIEKVYDLIGAIIASIIGIIILGMETYLIAIALSALALIFFLMCYRPAFDLFLGLIAKRKFFSKYIENISDSYEIIKKSTSVKSFTICTLLSIAYWSIISAGVYYILAGFGIDMIDYLKILSIYTSSAFLGAITFIPGGIGVTEGSLTGLLSIQGVDISVALVLSVMIRLFAFWYPVCVGFISLNFSGVLSFRNNSF
tara:strand:- start:981 stop:1925 length:945 start_codon:yes stop_codon:yes gene_type:complete